MLRFGDVIINGDMVREVRPTIRIGGTGIIGCTLTFGPHDVDKRAKDDMFIPGPEAWEYWRRVADRNRNSPIHVLIEAD